ncbi:bifunctional diguanylate cyclase/phosphodiesterase [Actinotalea sp. JY-7876]|uniref:putative bifunctional diguanylate cyclase/phosphodiesterase n=1 Tax=Actinotalea sp. JY-7876 TaxID=2758442 RepID=UPI0015F5BF57|nr:bifunctional diguanylate cyclase/phosphodiesterase [Actinotalea sp. JY-7876]
MGPASARCLAVGLLAAVAVVPLQSTALREFLIAVVGVLSVVAIVVGVRVHRPVRRAPWYLLAAGVGCWALGDVLWAVVEHVLGSDAFPSVADYAYVLAYPVLAWGLALLSRPAGRTAGRDALLDALIVATTLGLVLWVFFIAPSWTDPEGTLLERVVGVAYPVGDVVLVTQLVRLMNARRRTPALVLLGAGFGLVLVADLLFQAGAYLPVLAADMGLIDPLWIAPYACWAAAALHPSMARAGDEPSGTALPLTVRRVAFLAGVSLVLPALVLIEAVLGVPLHSVEVMVAALPLIGFVLLRMLGLVHRMSQQARDLAHLAETDFLTGLENGRRLTARIEDALGGPDAGAPARGAALLLVGVERFAEINETLGLRTGDELLRAVAGRLVVAADADGVVARLGGEAFGVLLPGVRSGTRAVERAIDIRELFAEPFRLGEVTVSVDIAIGVALAPDDAADAGALLQRADVALSAARERRDLVARYAQQMETGGALTPQLMSELTSAMAENQVVVHFQPQVEISTGRVVGVEALVRWQHPEHGMLGPLAFVPAAERTGLIRALTLHVLDRTLAQAALWRAGGRTIPVSVNLSVRNLLDPHFVNDVRRALERHRIPATQLELEVTETMAMLDPARSLEVLGALDELGVMLSVDDYGTGYSSLAYLTRLPVRRLKIDRSFVAGLLDDDASAAIVRSTVELARHLGLAVVAEGVEDDATLLALRDMGCYAAQGFGLGRPTSADRIPAMLDAIETRVPGLVRERIPVQRTA